MLHFQSDFFCKLLSLSVLSYNFLDFNGTVVICSLVYCLSLFSSISIISHWYLLFLLFEGLWLLSRLWMVTSTSSKHSFSPGRFSVIFVILMRKSSLELICLISFLSFKLSIIVSLQVSRFLSEEVDFGWLRSISLLENVFGSDLLSRQLVINSSSVQQQLKIDCPKLLWLDLL